jgi:hypothetical protein
MTSKRERKTLFKKVMDLIEQDEEAKPVEALNQSSNTMGEKLAKFLLAKYQNAPN